MKLLCALVLTLTNLVIATPFGFSVKGSGASAKAGAVTAPFGIFGVVQPVASNAGYGGSFSKPSSLISASGGTALGSSSFSHKSAQDNRAPWPGYGTSFTTQAQAVGQNVLTFPQVNKNSITSFSDTSIVATTGANGQTEITGSYPSENSNDLYLNNSGASESQYQVPSEKQEKNPSSTLGEGSLKSETYEISKPSALNFITISKVPDQSVNLKERPKVQKESSQIVTGGSAYLTFPNGLEGNTVPQTTVASSENYQISEKKTNYNGGFGGPPGILKPFDKGSNFKSNDSPNAFLNYKPNVQLSAPVTTKPEGFDYTPENTIKPSYAYTNKGSTDKTKPTVQPLSSGSSNFNAGISYKPERNPTYAVQIEQTFANNIGKPLSVLKPNDDQVHTLQHFYETTHTSDRTLSQSIEDSSKPQFFLQIPSKFNKPTIDAFSQSKPINKVQVAVQAYPSNGPNSSSNYNVNYENNNVGNESSEKLSNKPTKQSLYTGSFGAPAGVLKPFDQLSPSSTFASAPENPEVYDTSKSYLGFTVTGQKETTNTGGSSNILSATQQPSVISANYNTNPAPFSSSTPKFNKKDNVPTTVQTETNQPSNKPSQNSSFNLTNQKNPSLFNVASSGVQSSTLGSNSYPIKPQFQLPEKQVFESGSQNKPLFNTFGTFGTPKPTSYLGSTGYTSFSYPGYGNSGVFGSLDKSKPTSQVTTTNQYKPSFTTSFGGQSGVLKPSNQPTQTSSTFISSNKPTNYKPVVTPSPLNIAKPNEDYLVTDQKDSSIVNNFGTVSSSPQPSSDTASQQPSIVNTSYNTSPAPFISSNSPSSESNAENHKDDSGPAISSTSKTDKKDDVTITVQTETNQPSHKPSQSSSFILTNQKNPSLFNVASLGVQSSTLGPNSYPIKPQSQLSEKQVFESGSQNKPLLSNTFGTFVTPKPTSYPESTAYTSFSSPGYGNSGVFGSSDNSKPTSQFTTTNQYKPSFTTSFGGQSGVLKPSNQPTQTSSTFISSNKPANYKPVVTPSPLNIAKPNEDYLVTDQKDSSIVNNLGTVSSSPQPSSDTASQQPSIVNANYDTSPAPFISSNSPSSESNAENHKDASDPAISSISKTDKKDDVTTTVQTETNQPSHKPSQSSSFILTNQKNPSLFNVASSGVQSSTLGSNSYPIIPQSQLPEKQVFESGSQNKPLISNTFGTFVTPKPTSFPESTAYTSFSSSGYGNSGVFGSSDKSKPTSQFTTMNQYKPSFTTSFGEQSGVLKPSNQPTQTSSTFISSNKTANYKPVVTPSPLNIAKPNEDYLVTDQKDSSIVNNLGTVSSSPQPSSDTASQQPSIVNANYDTSPAPFISSNSPSSESNAENHKDASDPAISSISKTDKKDDVTTTVQTETNQPSNKPFQSSSFNLSNQTNPSLFASSGVQSSTLGSNSYPIKPQSQLPEKQVFESGSLNKPLISNTFGTFVTPKPTSYPDSTAYTSFSSPGYGNSGVFGSSGKSKPTSQFTTTNQYKPSFTTSFGGQSGVLKPSNQPTQTSSTFISSNKPANYKPVVTPSPLNIAKPNEDYLVTDQKDSSIVNNFGTVSSSPQPSSDTASQQPSIVNTNYDTSPAPFISSNSPSSESNAENHKDASDPAISNISKTDTSKKDDVTTTVQTETNQPSNKPFQSSSFNLSNQKNPSLFNVASSGVQSSTLGSNSYPIKPQSQLPEKQVFESGSQNKPLISNTFGTFVTPKPTSYPESTAYTSFSSPGYGNSGVFGSSDKSKPTSQFTTTNQYKPSFTTSFGGQSGVLKPSNQPTQTSSTFISSNKPANYKPVVTPSPLNIAKPNEDYLVTDQKDSSIVNNLGTVSSSPQPSSDTASQQPSIVNANYDTSPAPFISSNSPSSESNAENHKDASDPAISSISKTDKKDDVTTTVQTETNQPSHKPSQSSSFILTNQKNPSLFNVASSGVQSSTLGSNSYPIIPQSQLPEKQVFESGSQNKPLISNTFGTFVTPKPTSFPESTAYTSFSSSGYGNSGVFGSSDKSKPTSQFTTMNQYKPSFTTSFGEQSGVLKPSNQPTQTSSTFISFNKPANYKPVVTPSPLNIAKPNEDYLVTDQKDSSIVNNFGTVSSSPQPSSITASQQPSIVNTNYNTSPAPFISSNSPSSESNAENHKDASDPAISSISKTDKKDDVTTTVQTETNQPSNKPFQSSSFNLSNQKNPSLFASSGVQSSTLGSNPYPIKPQSQLPEKQVFESGSLNKPLISNTFGTFVTPKPTSYPDSTAYTSFSSPGYGNSGVFGSSGKSKPTSQFTTTNQYKPSFTTSFGGQSGVLKPSNQPTQTSSTFISSNKPANYKPVVTPSPLNIAKPNEDYLVTDQKDSSIVNNFGTVSSSPQPSSDTASQQPSIVNTNYNTSPAPFISSNLPSSESNAEKHKDASGPVISNTSKTDKKDDFITTVQTETNQPSNNLSQSSSFNLTNQKNSSLFNVASSGVQSSTLSSNSYPIKPQSQFPEKPVLESGSQKKPLLSNTFGTFGTPKPTSYLGSTAYTSFSSPGYGNSGVLGSLDKSKPTSQFTTTNQYKPSFTTSFGGQSGVQTSSFTSQNKPQFSSDFGGQIGVFPSNLVSSNTPLTSKPFVSPVSLNKSPQTITSQKVSELNRYNFESVTGFQSAYVPSKSSSQQFSGNSALFNIPQGDFHLSKPNIQTSVIGQPIGTTVQLPYAGGFGGPAGILKPNEFSAPANHINILSQYNPNHYNQALATPHRELNLASYSGGFGGSSGVLKPVKKEIITSAGNTVNDNQYFSIVHSSGLQGTLTENPAHSNYNLIPNKSLTEVQSNFEQSTLGSKATEEAQSGVEYQASVAATKGTGEFINPGHNIRSLERSINNGASSGIGLELPKNNKSLNGQIGGLKIFRLAASNQGSTENGISSNAFGKSLAPGSAIAQGSSGFITKNVFGRK